MASFLPSEISRLVLGYLEEINCMTAYDEFLKTCPNLQECRGRHFDTRVMGNTLINILRDYSKAEAEMYYNKNKELQRLLRQRWSLVQRMRFLVDNVDMSKVRQYSSNNSPFPLCTPRKSENDRKQKLCPQCKASECGCTRAGLLSPALSDLYNEPININPVQIATGSVPVKSLVEATLLSDLPGTSTKDNEKLIPSSNSRSCSKPKVARLSHDSGVTTVSQKSMDTPGLNVTSSQTQEKDNVNVIVNSEHNMSIDSSLKGNVLLECSEALSHGEGQNENCAGKSRKHIDSTVPVQTCAKEKDNSFQEFLSGVAAQYDNKASKVIGESSTPDPTLQGRISTCATKTKPAVTAAEVNRSQITKESAFETKTIKTLLPRNASFLPNCEEKNFMEQMQAKPPDENNVIKIYETKPNVMSTRDSNSDEIITLYGTDNKDYTTLETIDIDNFYHQTNTQSNFKNTQKKQFSKPTPNDQKIIILSNEIVEPKAISCNKEPVNTLQESNYITQSTMHMADKKSGVHYRSNSDLVYTNNGTVMHTDNRGIFNMKGNSEAFQQTSNAMVNIPEPVLSQRLRAQICSTQGLEAGKGTVLAGKLPELIISNGQVQLGQIQGKVLEEPKYYSEKEIMSMPTLIMLHSQSSGADNGNHYSEPPAPAGSFLAQELPPMQTAQAGKRQTSVPSHIPTQPVQTKPNLSNHTKTTTAVQINHDTQTEIDSVQVHMDLTEAATPHTNPDVKKSSSTPRRQNSHIRVLDFNINTPSREIKETKARTLPKNLQATPISASRCKRRAKSNLFDIKEFNHEDNKAASSEVNTAQASEKNADNFDTESQATEKRLVKVNVTCVEINGPVVKCKPCENSNHYKHVEKLVLNDNTKEVPGLKEWQALRTKKAGWDADLRALAVQDTGAAGSNPPKRPKPKTSHRKIKQKNDTTADTKNESLNTGKELDTSLEKNAHLLELALSADKKKKTKQKKPAAPRKRNPQKKKVSQNEGEPVSEYVDTCCKIQNTLPQTNIANRIENTINNDPIKENNKTSVQENSLSKIYVNNEASKKLPLIQNHCIINDISSITSVPGAKQALDKKVISINVGHYVNEIVQQENNNPTTPSTNNQDFKPEISLQRDNIEKVCNVSSDKDHIESPLLPYDIISPDVQFLIPSSAMRNLSSLLETPLKMSLDIPMMTPRFISPGSLIDPMSVLKHLEIPTPNFSNTPRENLLGKSATPSSYVSRPTDYSSGSSYYKPDDNEYRIDIAAGEDIDQNPNLDFVLPNTEINHKINQINKETSKEVGNTVENKISANNQYLTKSLEISLEKLEAENNATPEQRSTRPRRTCTLKNLPRPKSPLVIEKNNKTTITVTESSHQDSSCDSLCSSSSSSSSSSEHFSNSSSFSRRTPIVKSSTPKEMEIRTGQLADIPQKSRDDNITLTPQSKGKMSLQERVARSMEEKRKRIITKMSMSQKVSPKKKPIRPRVRKLPANKKKCVTKNPIVHQNVNLCIRRDSTKPVSLTRTVSQGKKGSTKLAKESCQPTVLHKVPCLAKSRRKSSTPRKLESLRLETESESHTSPSTTEMITSTLENDNANSAHKEGSETASNSKHSAETSYIQTEPVTLSNKKDIGSLLKRDDSVDDIMKIKDYIAESAKCNALATRSNVRQSNHYESAKKIESDLLDPTGETKEMLSTNEECFSVRTEKKNGVQNNTENYYNNSKLEKCEKQGYKKVEKTVKQNITKQLEEESSDNEDVVEWTNSESGPGQSNYFCVSYSGTPETNQFPRNSNFNADTFCMAASIMVDETGAEDVRKIKVGPLVTFVSIAPSKTKSKPSKHCTTSKTKKTSEKSKKKEKVMLVEKSAAATLALHCTEKTLTTKNVECLEKLEENNVDVSQMETLLAVQSIVQMETLYTPDKSRMPATKHNSLSHRINHQQPSEDQMCESVSKELERRKRRQIMKDIGLTDSSGGETSDSEVSATAVAEPGSCRKRRHLSNTHYEEPPDKKCKPSGSKLDPQTFLKTMGIESVLSKIHGPSN